MSGYPPAQAATYYQEHKARAQELQRARYRRMREARAESLGYSSPEAMDKARAEEKERRVMLVISLHATGLKAPAISLQTGISVDIVRDYLALDPRCRHWAKCDVCPVRRECMAAVIRGEPMPRQECGAGEMFWSPEPMPERGEGTHESREYETEYDGPRGRAGHVPRWGTR